MTAVTTTLPSSAPRAGVAAAAVLLFDAQATLERIQPGSPAVAEIGMQRLLAEVRAERAHDLVAVHRAGVHA